MTENVQKMIDAEGYTVEKAGRFRTALATVRSALSGERQKERAALSYPMGLLAVALCTLLLNSAEYSPPAHHSSEPAIAHARIFAEHPDEPTPTQAPVSGNTETSSPSQRISAAVEALSAPHEFMERVERSQVDSAIILHFGANDELLGYQLINQETGETSAPIPFFKRQKEALAEAQTKAKETDVPQIANFTVIDNTFSKPTIDLLELSPNSPDSPWVTEKPADVLTNEELAANGITILNPSGDSAKLHLRKSILEDGLLKPLVDLRALDPEYKVVIVPVDAPFITWGALDKNQEEELLRLANDFGPGLEASMRGYDAMHEQNAYAIRTTFANQMKQNVAGHMQNYEMAQTDAERHDAHYSVRRAAENDLLVQSLSDAELALSFYRDYHGNGLFRRSYTTGLHYNDSGAKQNFLFISMGDANANMGNRIFLWAQPDGSIKTSYMYPPLDAQGMTSNIPTPDKNYRTTLDYGVNPFASKEDDQYRLLGQDSAQILRHEIAHAALITWVPKLHELYSEVPNFTYPWLEDLAEAAGIEYPDVPSRSEFLTDTMTIGSIDQAEQWLTEHGSDKGYSFVFEIPPNAHTPDTTYSISQKAQDTIDAVAADAAQSLSRYEST